MSSPNDRWAALHSRERNRLDRTVRAVPRDAMTGLEIGFGDLRMSELLRRRLDLVSIDLPRKVDDPGNGKVVFSGITNLPFRDAAFDIVVCTEVLEHLSDDVLAKAVHELRRVSRRYLLVSVPYRQRVWNELYKCAHCGFVANTMGHVRSFDERALLALFPGALPLMVELIGSISGYAPDLLYWMSSRIGNAWQDLMSLRHVRDVIGPPRRFPPMLWVSSCSESSGGWNVGPSLAQPGCWRCSTFSAKSETFDGFASWTMNPTSGSGESRENGFIRAPRLARWDIGFRAPGITAMMAYSPDGSGTAAHCMPITIASVSFHCITSSGERRSGSRRRFSAC